MSEKFYIDSTAKINYQFRNLQGCNKYDESDIANTTLPKNIYIGAYCLIGKGVILHENIVIDSFCTVEMEAEVGMDTLITYKATIGGNVKIGKECVIGGFISENTIIGDRCRVFGSIVHPHTNSLLSWDYHEIPEPAVTIKDDCFIGFGALISGDIIIGPSSYVAAGAIVTRTIPPKHIAFGTNKIVHYSEWKGNLKNNPIFK